MIQMHKIINGAVDVDKKLFVNAQESATRGHNLKLRKSKATKLPRIRAFSNRVIDDWNELPSKVVNTLSTNSFKAELDNTECMKLLSEDPMIEWVPTGIVLILPEMHLPYLTLP